MVLTVLRWYGILPAQIFSKTASVGVGEQYNIMLNSRQAAALLDLSPDTVNELARKHTLPAVKRGRRWRFRQCDVSSFKKQVQERAAA